MGLFLKNGFFALKCVSRGELERETGPDAGRTVYRNDAVMKLQNALGDGKAQPGSVAMGAVRLIGLKETVEYMG